MAPARLTIDDRLVHRPAVGHEPISATGPSQRNFFGGRAMNKVVEESRRRLDPAGTADVSRVGDGMDAHNCRTVVS